MLVNANLGVGGVEKCGDYLCKTQGRGKARSPRLKAGGRVVVGRGWAGLGDSMRQMSHHLLTSQPVYETIWSLGN